MYRITVQTLTGNEHTIYIAGDQEYTLTSATLSLKVGEAGEFNFTVPFNNPMISEIVQKSIITIYENGDEIWRGDIRDIQANFDKSVSVYALEDLAWLNDDAVSMHKYTGKTYSYMFSIAMQIHNAAQSVQAVKREFTKGRLTAVTSSDICTWKPVYEMTLLDCMREFIAKSDGFIKIRRVTEAGWTTRYVDIVKLEDYGNVATQTIDFGENLMDYVKDIDITNFVNDLRPVGAETETPLYDDVLERITGTNIVNQTSIDTYGHSARQVIFETDNVNTLNRLAAAYLSRYSTPKMTFEVKAVDLGNIENVSTFKLGDYVRIRAKAFELDQWVYITEQTVDLLDISNNVLQLSDTVRKSSLTSQFAATNYTVNALQTPASVLENAKKNALSILEGDNGGIVVFVLNSDDQIIEQQIINNADISQATKAWRWNINGLAYLHRTYTTDPWTVGVAMTMDGSIVADFITTGLLSDGFGLNYWNLETGEFQIAPGAKIGGSQNTISDLVLDSDLDQDEIFDRLTDGQTGQGIYLQNGNLYLNANMIAAGKMSANYLRAGIIESENYFDNGQNGNFCNTGMQINLNDGTMKLPQFAYTSAKTLEVYNIQMRTAPTIQVETGYDLGIEFNNNPSGSLNPDAKTLLRPEEFRLQDNADDDKYFYVNKNMWDQFELNVAKDYDHFTTLDYNDLVKNVNSSSYSVTWTLSDKRKKEQITELDAQMSVDFIDATHPKRFKYKDADGIHYGMLAQDAREVLDELGETDARLERSMGLPKERTGLDDQRTIDYQEYIPHLINYVKDLRAEISALKDEIKQLKEDKRNGNHADD